MKLSSHYSGSTFTTLLLTLFAATSCGRSTNNSTVASSNGGGRGTATEASGSDSDPDGFELISDDDIEKEIGLGAYKDDHARVKIFARGQNGECSDWRLSVKGSPGEVDALSMVFVKGKKLERRDNDGVYGVDSDGKETLLTRENRGKSFPEFLLMARTHSGRDGMVLLAKDGSSLTIEASYKTCIDDRSGNNSAPIVAPAPVTFPKYVIEVKTSKHILGTTKDEKPAPRKAAILVKIKSPKAESNHKKGSGKGSNSSPQ